MSRQKSLEHDLQEAYRRLERLVVLAQDAGTANPLLLTAIDELSTVVEELAVANEELIAQHDLLVQTQQQAEADRERYHGLFEFAPDAFIVTAFNGVIMEANQAASALLGYSAGYLPGKPLLDFIPESEQKAFFALLDASAQAPRKVQHEFLLQPRVGAAIPVAVTFAPILAPDGTTTGFHWQIRDVTARKQMEKALRDVNEELEQRVTARTAALEESRGLLHEVLESSLDAIYRRDLQHDRYDYLSPAIEQITGYTPDAMRNMRTDEALACVHPDDLPNVQREILRTQHGGKATLEYRFRDPSGVYRWLSDSFQVLLDADGTPRYRAGVTHDITARRQAMDALRESQARLHRAEQIAEFGSWSWDFQTNAVTLSPGAMRFANSESPVTTFAAVQALVHPDDLPAFQQAVKDALGSGMPFTFEFRALSPDGAVHYLQNRGEVEYDDTGRPLRLLGTAQDITARKLAEAALCESEAKFRLLADMAQSGIGIVQDGVIKYINPYVLQLGGYEEHDLLGKSFLTVIHPEYHALLVERMQQHLRGEAVPDRYEIMAVSKDRQSNFWIDFQVVLIEYQGRPAILATAYDITERKQMEEALRQSEERQRLFVEHAPAAIALFDREMRYLAVSRRWLEDYSLTDEVIGQSHYAVLPEIPEHWKAVHRRCLAGETERCEEDEFVRADGSVQWLHWQVHPWRDQNGEIGGIIIFTEDITARKHAEAALRVREAQLQAILQNTPAMIYLMTPDHRFIHVNRQFEMIFSQSGDEIRGLAIQEVFSPEFAAAMAEHNEQVFELGVTDIFEESLPLEDGLHTYTSAKTPLYDVDGRPVALVGISVDITERKRAEAERERLLQEIAHNAAELDAALDAIPDGIVITNAAGQIIRVNPALKMMLGITGPVPSLNLAEAQQQFMVAKPDGIPLTLAESTVWRALQGDYTQNSLTTMRCYDGRTIWVNVSSAPIYGAHDEILGAIASLVDVTEQREQQQRQEDMLHLISHDLRIPLTVMHGHMELLELLLKQHDLLVGDAQLSIEAIHRSSHRMNVMIQDLVDAARLEARQLFLVIRPLSLDQYLRDLLAQTKTGLETQRITLEIEEGLPTVGADADRLDRIVINLLTNALKYSPPDSPVRVQVSRAEEEVKVAVIDAGQGIEPADRQYLFDRFYRARLGRKADGVGLGLYITRLLVQAHGGRLWLDSEPGHGSTFVFTLPIVHEVHG